MDINDEIMLYERITFIDNLPCLNVLFDTPPFVASPEAQAAYNTFIQFMISSEAAASVVTNGTINISEFTGGGRRHRKK